MQPLRDPPQMKRYTKTKSKGIEKYISFKWKGEKKSGVAILLLDKINFKTKAIIKTRKYTT